MKKSVVLTTATLDLCQYCGKEFPAAEYADSELACAQHEATCPVAHEVSDIAVGDIVFRWGTNKETMLVQSIAWDPSKSRVTFLCRQMWEDGTLRETMPCLPYLRGDIGRICTQSELLLLLERYKAIAAAIKRSAVEVGFEADVSRYYLTMSVKFTPISMRKKPDY